MVDFSESAATYVEERVWSRDQRFDRLEDGTLRLTLRTAPSGADLLGPLLRPRGPIAPASGVGFGAARHYPPDGRVLRRRGGMTACRMVQLRGARRVDWVQEPSGVGSIVDAGGPEAPRGRFR